MNDNIEVTVVCTTYNHENYIEDCLKSLLNQKTDFNYEVLVNDDASTDKTAKILKKYLNQYPDKLRVFFQEDNLFSKGIRIVDDVLLPNSRGKYIAICEGDDKWLDENKLQLQYNLMEENKDCVMCTHNTLVNYENNKNKNYYFNNWRDLHTLDDRDVFLSWKVHTSSYFIRKEFVNLDPILRGYWFGDYVRLTYLHSEGKIISLPYVMSQYNIGITTGALDKFNKSTEEQRRKGILDRCKYLKDFNKFSSYRFNNIINKRILMSELEASSINEFDTLHFSDYKKEIIEAVKSISSKKEYKKYYDSLTLVEKIKSIIRYKGYFLYPIWIELWKK